MAYGCYGIALEGAYDRLISYVIQSGITVAFCHIRGGGEYGEEWHRQAIKKTISSYLSMIFSIALKD
ncbi:prolyl oligopeptidase family serine peptidase [Bifidobacterium adolescentis]|uniref:prolyl oligopeptidase family serine peptidase n=1 Tax=Bifidobacterium adolescentis TaxID=1680 RepID=UPI003CFE9FE2